MNPLKHTAPIRVAGVVVVAALLLSAAAVPTALAAAPPTISSFAPTSGPVGTSVVIAGINFTGATEVKFHSTPASFTVDSDVQITATVPAGATDGAIKVTTPAGTATSAAAFNVTSPKPTITSFAPTSGPVGTSVTIVGTNFTGVTAVTFRGTPAAFTVDSPMQITGIVPSGAATGPIRVTNASGTGTSATDFVVTNPAPTITSFSPASGSVGTAVTINGTNFTGVTTVKFNTTAAAFLFVSDTTITATVPSGATTGPIHVTTPGGTANSASNFTVTGAPAITSFSPTSGPPGTTVTIFGQDFVGVTQVRFNNTAAAFVVSSPTQITATVPSGATTGPIHVTTPGGTATSATNFVVISSKPIITSFSPTSGPVGTSVTIVGVNFLGSTSVTFNYTAAAFVVNSSTQVTATVPAGALSGRIRVTNPSGTGVSSVNFTVTHPNAPTITSFSPTSGPVGTSVTIFGTNFTGTTQVKFNNTFASFVVNSSTQITTTVPSGATTGLIRVTNPSGTGVSRSNFVVTTGVPTITSFSPTSGPVGTSVTIFGTNFTGTTQVKFNNTFASFVVNSSTQITAIVPSGATTGRIHVTTPRGTATSSTDFVVTTGVPTITSFSPTSGPVGTSVAINGTNFSGATAVKFNNTFASFVVNSSTRITATVPSGATSGQIHVTTPGGTATSASSFTVTSPVHPRRVSLVLHVPFSVSGTVSVTDGFSACRRHVPVNIQRKAAGTWRWVATRWTGLGGFFGARLPDRAGWYRARLLRRTLPSGAVCGAAVSGAKFHR